MNTKQDARKLDLVGKADPRWRVVRAVLQQELTKAEAARIFGISRTSVHAWLNLYMQGGIDGLTPKRTGRPSVLVQSGWHRETSPEIDSFARLLSSLWQAAPISP